jgi:signal transduction histidine kinase
LRVRALGRPEVSRGGLGVTLVLAGGFAYLWASGATRPAGETVLAGLAVLIAVALIFAPSWRRLARSLAAERTERIRSQERADVGAHLHDSVLQTLALIQRNADSPREVARLARGQERTLRTLLYGDRAASGNFAAQLRAAAAEVEDDYAITVDAVVVGDAELDDALAAVTNAAREAMVNAAKHSGVETVSVYAELDPDEVSVFVKDRGVGFEMADIADDRQGIRGSIIGRVERHGGTARMRSEPGGGTEVEIRMPRGPR